jgi:hypothetical protein
VPEEVTCTVCGEDVGKGPAGLGLAMHGKTHREEFRRQFGRKPENYQEVRDKLGKPIPTRGDDQTTLWEALNDPEQASLPWGDA